ncbi:protein SWEETIE isoform X2 [Typha latifolia]|uniref:protein SWEETIE isoform X2 n=1 Tax=Typha latifolia TaxID=4733 RepID=UPI003C2C5DE6
MAKRDAGAISLSRFGVLVAQLESIVASAAQQPPDALLCFDLLSELVAAIDEEPKESIQLSQRKCEDALCSLLILGARRPVRRLASSAIGKVIAKGDGISIYARASNLQGWLADGKRSDPLSCSGAAQCLGELYRLFGRRITSGLIETTNITAKLMKFHEEFVRQDALLLLENALEGCGGTGAFAAYSEAYRIIMRIGISDKSFIVRLAAARCLKTFASIGGPGLGITELENSMSCCVKGLEDHISSVRDAFAEALGALLALSMNPEAQVKKRGKSQPVPARKLENGLQKHLIMPFIKGSGANTKNIRIGLTFSWVFFLQVIHLKYHFPDSELQNIALQAMDMLQGNGSLDPHALACVLYVLRVGVADQMTEPTQRSFLVLLGRKLESSDCIPPMRVAILRILSYLLISLGEVPAEFKDVLDNTVVAALSHSSLHVRVEAALTLRALAEVDPTCVGGLISYGVTTLHALRESAFFDKGNDLHLEIDSLHGQATVLAALVAISPKLLLGYPARLPKSVFEVSKKMLSEFSRNPMAATVERESGWLLLASLLASMPKEELEDQVFDVLLLWADPFAGNPESYFRQTQDWASELRVLSVAIEALTAFIRSFISPTVADSNGGILLHPVLAYLSGALFLISSLSSKKLPNVKAALDLFTSRTIMAYQCVCNPMAYKSEHAQLIQICTSPFSDPSGYEESSCLRFLLDKRDAWLGPWIPGRDWFEDELRAFDGGRDGLLPCVWDDEVCSFPQPESISRMLVNQMLLCFGTIFACQDNRGKLMLLNKIDQCLNSGKKQSWHMTCITNACVGLLSGLKAVLALRPQALAADILSTIQSIFQGIMAETEISSAQRRAVSEGLGLLARVGNDVFTARMTRVLLGELTVATDPNYIGTIALSLGCIHRSAGGMALSTLVPATVSSISLLGKNSNASVQLWSLHALLLTIEAAGLSYVSQVQATLFLAMEILLLEENGYLDLRQEIGHLINVIVAVLGPELAPGSTFFSRCKSVIAEISSCKETATLLESVRFTQQLVIFAPQAIPVHYHVISLLPTLSSKQPSLRYLAVSTLHHLIEKDPISVIDENIEENLFSMLDEETDSEIASLVRATINKLLYASCPLCPSRWLRILRSMALATSLGRNASVSLSSSGHGVFEGEKTVSYGEDDEDMITSSKGEQIKGLASSINDFARRNKHLRYRTKVFAAECLSFLPTAVGTDPAHFDLSLARTQIAKGNSTSNDWLVLNLQELVSLSYQISTGKFEGMQPIGLRLLSIIMDKFGKTPDPEFPGHILLEQYQAQLASAVRSAISTASGPLLLEAGLELATKILTSRIIGGDRIALNRLFSLISRPLSDMKDLYYPSFAEWVACKIKVRLLAAHASIKCYVYQFLREQKNVPDEYLQLTPLLANSSTVLGKYWISLLKDYCYICFGLHLKFNHKPFLDGIQSLLVSSKVQKNLDESWPLILQATALDAVPGESEMNRSMNYDADDLGETSLISGRSMVKLESNEFHFLWGLSLLVLFNFQEPIVDEPAKMVLPHNKEKLCRYLLIHGPNDVKSYEIALPVFLSLSKEVFFSQEFLQLDICKELLQVLVYADCSGGLALNLVSQVAQLCPENFFWVEDFAFAVMELCTHYLILAFQSTNASSQDHSSGALLSELSITAEIMACRMKNKHQWKLAASLVSVCYQSFKRASSNLYLSKIISFLQNIAPFLKKCFKDGAELNDDYAHKKAALGAWTSTLANISSECTERMCILENKMSDSYKLVAKIFVFSLEEIVALAKLVHVSDYLRQKEANGHVLMSIMFRHCIESISAAFHDANIQVQMLGLHVLKDTAQRELVEDSHERSPSFFLLLAGELLGDIFYLIQLTLKKCICRASITVINECLKLLFLVHTLAQTSNCKQAVTVLLLEALLMAFFLSCDSHSQELSEVNSITRRLVSHLIQIPSSASQIKDVMLSASVTRRQQLQDMIRASVNQSQMPMQVNSSMQSKPNAKDGEIQSSDFMVAHSEPHDIQEKDEDRKSNSGNDDDDNDDWDAFQSLPASNASASTNNAHIGSEKIDVLIVADSSNVDDHMYESSPFQRSTSDDSVYEEVGDTEDSAEDAGEATTSQNEHDEPLACRHSVSDKIIECDRNVEELPKLSSEAGDRITGSHLDDDIIGSFNQLPGDDEELVREKGFDGDALRRNKDHKAGPESHSDDLFTPAKNNEEKSNNQVLLNECCDKSITANEDHLENHSNAVRDTLKVEVEDENLIDHQVGDALDEGGEGGCDKHFHYVISSPQGFEEHSDGTCKVNVEGDNLLLDRQDGDALSKIDEGGHDKNFRDVIASPQGHEEHSYDTLKVNIQGDNLLLDQ